MENPTQAVIDWLNSGADYDQGVSLYSLFGKNRNMAILFPGKKHRMELKLRYELCTSQGFVFTDKGAYRAYRRGRLRTEAELRSAIRQAALNGSSPAQQMMISFLNDSDI